MLTEKDIDDVLKKWIKNNPSDEDLMSQVGLTQDEQALPIAQELANELYEIGGKVAKRSGGNLFSYSSALSAESWNQGGLPSRLSTRRTKTKEQLVARILIHGDALRRDSFLNAPENGDMLNDVVALFTTGAKYDKFVYGHWDSAGKWARSHAIGNAPGLAPNSFIDDTIDAFKNKYSGLITKITYPEEWHSHT